MQLDRRGRTFLAVAASFLMAPALLPGGSAAAQTAPAPQIAAPLETVIDLPPLSLKTKDMSPGDAFALLGKQAGVTFGALPDAGQRANVDFDIENVSFWKAADLLCAAASVSIAGGENMKATLVAPRKEFSPLASGDIYLPKEEKKPYRAGLMVSYPVTSRTANLTLDFDLDPRIHIVTAGEPVVEALKDANGAVFMISVVKPPAVAMLPPRPSTARRSSFTLSTAIAADKPANGGTEISMLRGYVPITFSTAPHQIEFPVEFDGSVKAAATQNANGWIITLSDAGRSRSRGGSGPLPPDHLLALTIQRDQNSPPFPNNIRSILRLVSNTGDTLGLQTSGPETKGEVKDNTLQQMLGVTTQTHGPNGGPTLPTKLILEIPADARQAILPFEFKDIVLPDRLQNLVK